jgi:hypothetical protein
LSPLADIASFLATVGGLMKFVLAFSFLFSVNAFASIDYHNIPRNLSYECVREDGQKETLEVWKNPDGKADDFKEFLATYEGPIQGMLDLEGYMENVDNFGDAFVLFDVTTPKRQYYIGTDGTYTTGAVYPGVYYDLKSMKAFDSNCTLLN